MRRPVAVFRGIGDTFAEHKSPSRPGGPSANPGTDYYAHLGDDILMPANGMVVAVKKSSLVGNWIGIDFDDGKGGDLLHNNSVLAKPGTWYREGTHIAEAGMTGSVATGVHSHFALRLAHGHHLESYRNVDPEKYMTAGIPGTGELMPTLAEIVAGVWARPVARAGKSVSAIQELADAKSTALAIQAQLPIILAAIKSIDGIDPAELQAALDRAIAGADLDVTIDDASLAAAVDAALKDDFAALASKITTGDAAVLAAIAQVDENTLATFGLKRA